MVPQLPSYTKYKFNSFDSLRQSILTGADSYVAVDTETTGLRWDAGDRAFGVAIAWDNNCIFLRNSEHGVEGIRHLLKEIFNTSEKTFVYHNAEFDLHMLRETYGVDPAPTILDTLRVSHLYNTNMSHSLKDWSTQVFGNTASYYESLVEEYRSRYNIKDYSRIPPEIMDSYATNDVVLTKSLAERFVDPVRDDNPSLFDLEMRLIPVIYDMEKMGLKLDIEYTDSLRKEMVQRKRIIEDEIYSIVGKPLDIASSKQLGAYFYGRLRLKPSKKTATDLPSTDNEALSEIKDEVGTPVAKAVLDWRALDKVVSTYLSPFLAIHREGRIHPRWNAVGTVTGRFSSSSPNFQNVPKDQMVRKVIVPDNEFVVMDYSQVELRVMAHVANQKNMIEAFIDGKDLHAMTAGAISQKPLDEVTDKDRSIGKRINFGVIYGIGPKKFAQQANIGVDEAKRYLDNYWKEYPAIKKFFDATIRNADRTGYVKTLFGRKVGIDPERPYAAVNYVVQGTAGDIVKISLLRTYNYLQKTGGKIRNTVHDEILFDELDEEQIPELKKIMENFTFSMPLDVDVERSKTSWGDLLNGTS